jgi:hypothetical protein
MDTEPTSFGEFDGYLRDLERVNVLTLAYRPTLLWLKRAMANFPGGRPISVLGVGSGRSGMLRRLRKWARGKKLQLDLTGVDINPWSTKSAAESTPPEMYIRFEKADILAQSEPLQTDFVISSSFTHHLDDADLVRFIRQMDRYANARLVHQRPAPSHPALFSLQLLPGNLARSPKTPSPMLPASGCSPNSFALVS